MVGSRSLVVVAVVSALLATAAVIAPPAGAEGTPTFNIDSVSIQEQNGGVGSLRFTITLDDPPTSGSRSVQYQTSPVTATERQFGSSCSTAADYLETFDALSLSENNPTGFVDVTICSDTFDEADETFNVTLFSPSSGSSIGTGTGVGTILDNDPLPSVSVPSANLSEGNAGTNNRTVPVTLSAASGRAVSFAYETRTTGTATAGAGCAGTTDFVTTSGTVVFPVGSTTPSTPLTLPVCGDTRDEPNETVRIRLSSFTNATGPSTDRTATIVDDDASTSTVAVGNTVASEASTVPSLSFPISLSGPAGQAITVNFATASGTATGGTSCTSRVDFINRSGSVTIPAGSTTATVSVSVCDDVLDELSESMVLNLTSAPDAAGISDNQGRGSIRDDDATPVLNLASAASVREGNTGTTQLRVVYTLTTNGSLQASGRPITYRFSTASLSALGGSCPGADFASQNLTRTINPGSRAGIIPISVCGDTTREATETMRWTASNLVGAIAGNLTGTGTILNDDGPALSVVDRSVTEGNGQQQRVTVRVNLSSAAPQAGRFSYSTTGGTAIPSNGPLCQVNSTNDFIRNTLNPVNVPAGATSVTLSFDICGFTQFELDDTVRITITSSDFVAIGDGEGILTIVNDDPLPG
jgi:hypothetical protein